MDGHVPLHFLQNTPVRGGTSGLHFQFHDIRLAGFQEPAQIHHQGHETRRQGLQAERCAGTHLHGQKQPCRGSGIRPIGQNHRRRPGRQETPDSRDIQVLSKPLQAKRRDGLRRSAAANQHPVPGFPGNPGKIPAKIRLHSRRRVPGHELRAIPHHQETGRDTP